VWLLSITDLAKAQCVSSMNNASLCRLAFTSLGTFFGKLAVAGGGAAAFFHHFDHEAAKFRREIGVLEVGPGRKKPVNGRKIEPQI